MTFLRGGKRAFVAMRIACLAMVAWGATTKVGLVWDTADAAMGIMALINLGAILLLSGVVVKLTRDYDAQLRAGKAPQLDAADYPELGDRIDHDDLEAARLIASAGRANVWVSDPAPWVRGRFAREGANGGVALVYGALGRRRPASTPSRAP